MEVEFPNIRKQFIPDDGYIIVDADLQGADAQVVAWEADDEELKQAFRDGLKIHVFNARTMFPKWKDASDEEIKKDKIYKAIKAFCHGTNYGASAATLSEDPNIRLPIETVRRLQGLWFTLHPGILGWHRRTEHHLQGTLCPNCLQAFATKTLICPKCKHQVAGTVRNAFGHSIHFFGFPTENFTNALAWLPQSTVAHVVREGLILLDEEFPFVEPLLQVHDSLLFQLPIYKAKALHEIKEALDSIVVPYPDPLKIPWGLSVSEKSWGDAQPFNP